jgi:hypothetical protein
VVEGTETALVEGVSGAKLAMPFVACCYQLLQPFQENNTMDIAFVIEHRFVAMLDEVAVIGTDPDHIKHKIVGLLLYDIFFQDKKE